MDRMGIHSSKRLGWVVAFSALMAFYYFIPELEITDSRYVLGTSDAFVRTGSLDMSDCLDCQAICHGRWSLRMALRMVRSFRATAMRATILGLPAATRRSKKALRMGLWRLATMAPMNRAVRTALRPPP